MANRQSSVDLDFKRGTISSFQRDSSKGAGATIGLCKTSETRFISCLFGEVRGNMLFRNRKPYTQRGNVVDAPPLRFPDLIPPTAFS